jgi:outer membrane protein assembly factor BamB
MMVKECARPPAVGHHVRRAGIGIIALMFLWSSPVLTKAATVPAHFQSYALTDIGGGLRCIVGDTTEEGSNGRAYVYLVDLTTHKMRWITKIPLPANRYQNRATHCLADDGKVYALVQSDTSSAQALSQTFVDVVTLDKASGHIESTEKVIAQEAGRTPSTWVDGGAESFRRDNGKIVVTGKFFNLDDPEARKDFTASPTP